MNCKTCGHPIYPPGITITGVSCMFDGNHPMLSETHSNLDEPIKELTKAIRELTKQLAQPQSTKQESEE